MKTFHDWFKRETGVFSMRLRACFTVSGIFDASFLCVIACGLGFFVSVALVLSFGLPDFHKGECFNFIFVSSPFIGFALLWCVKRLGRFFIRSFGSFSESALTILLVAVCVVFIYSFADVSFYTPRFFTVECEKNTQTSTTSGVYSNASEKMIPLTGAYSFTLPHGASNPLSVAGVDFGGGRTVVFSVSERVLSSSGARFQARRGVPLRITTDSGEIFIRTPNNSDHDSVRLPFTGEFAEMPDVISISGPYAAAFPGFLILGLLFAVYLRYAGYILSHCPLRIVPHAAGMLCAAGFFYSFYHFDLFYSVDPIGQFRQGLSGSYFEWHPPAMAFLWVRTARLLEWLFGTFSCAEAFTLLMKIPYWAGVFLIARRASRLSGLTGAAFALTAGFSPLFFPEFRFIFTMAWKDCLLVSFWLFAIGLALNMPVKKGFCRETVRFVAILFFAAGMGVRANACLGAIPLAFIFVSDLVELKKFSDFVKMSLLAALVFILAYGAVWNLQWTILKTVPQTPLSYPMMKELLAVRQLSGDKDWPDFLSEKCRRDFDARYNYYRNNGNTDSFLHGTMKIVNLEYNDYLELKAFWLEKIQAHPQEYLTQKWDSFHRQMRQYKIYSEMFNPWHILWIEAALCAISALIVLAWGKMNRAAITVFCISASGLAYVSTYYLFAFVWDFRYLSWFLYAGIIALALFPASNEHAPEK